MTKNEFIESSQAVQAHLSIIQSVINRMAVNSNSCKAWCITLVSAILVIVADKGKPQYTYIALVPACLFAVLDAYYLMLEKMFRNSYNAFIDKLHIHKIVAGDLYAVVPIGGRINNYINAILSLSVWLFYVVIIGMIFLVKYVVGPVMANK